MVKMHKPKVHFMPKRKSTYIYIYMGGSIDPICSNCIGKGWAQYPVSYVQITLERAGPNTQSEDERVSEDDQ